MLRKPNRLVVEVVARERDGPKTPVLGHSVFGHEARFRGHPPSSQEEGSQTTTEFLVGTTCAQPLQQVADQDSSDYESQRHALLGKLTRVV